MAKSDFHKKEAKKPKKDSKKPPVPQSAAYVSPEPEVVRKKRKPREGE